MLKNGIGRGRRGMTAAAPQGGGGTTETIPVLPAALALTGKTVNTPADAATVFVATTGNDGNPGTSASPKATLNGAAGAVAAGGYVVVRAGTYTGTQSFWASGANGNPIRIKPMQNEAVIFDGTGTAADTTLIDISGFDVVFEGFTVRNATRTGIQMWETKRNVIRACLVYTCTKGGIWVGGGTAGASSDNVIEFCEAYDCVRENVGGAMGSGGWAVVIALANSDNSIIRHCFARESWGEGLGILSSISAKILKSRVKDTFSMGIYLDNAQSAVCQQNLYWHTSNATYYRSGSPAHGCVIANEFTARQLPSDGLLVTDNTLVASPSIVRYDTFGANTGLVNSTIVPNTYYATLAAYQAAIAA